MSKMISVASGFQYSVNIGYDLNNDDKLKNFIPTRAAFELLEDILMSTAATSTNRARILIGAYGKGKSHIVLTILSMLMKRDRGLFVQLMSKAQENPKLLHAINTYYESDQRILPVIISGSNTSLSQAFLLALQRTLSQNGLLDIMPETNYKAALTVIDRWETEYPETYSKLSTLIDRPIETFKSSLEDYDSKAYETFERVYPMLTAGSIFNPFLGFDVVELYENAIKGLREKGFTGIYVVYDEFSKYLEANITEASVSDTKMLQDFAEKCNRSGDMQMHIMLISHKEIANYIDRLPKKKVDGWRGVSERFAHVHLNNNFAQTYEIIGTVIQKSERWSSFVAEHALSFDDLRQRYGKHALFAEMSPEEYDKAMLQCYPLHPVSTYILPRLSERVAQNERTLFTFLSADGGSTLKSFLNNYQDDAFELITPNLIYDYFEPLFRKEAYEGNIYKTFMLTTSILSQLDESGLESKLVKTISLIYILEQFEKLKPTTDELIAVYRANHSTEEITAAIENLIEKKFLIYRKRSNNYLQLKQSSGINVREKINDVVEIQRRRITVKETLNAVNFDNYIYPSQYNDEYDMTRYFVFEFIEEDEFVARNDWAECVRESQADGVIFGVIPKNSDSISALQERAQSISESIKQTIFVIPNRFVEIENAVREYNAVTVLREEAAGDKLLFDEYDVIYADLLEVVVRYIATFTRPEAHGAVYIQAGNKKPIFRKAALTKLASDICFDVFDKTPTIVNEVINRDEPTSIACNSRTKIVAALLRTELEPNLGLTGTGQEVSIMRSTLLRTGILLQEGVPTLNLAPNNERIAYMLKVIEGFILKARHVDRLPLTELYELLTGANNGIGMRRGLIPIYLAVVLHQYKQHVVLNNASGQVPVSADILNLINSNPEGFFISHLDWDADKEKTIQDIARIFGAHVIEAEKGTSAYDYAANAMRRWYMSLPRYAKECRVDPYGNKIDKRFLGFLRELKGSDSNYSLLFKKLPKAFDYQEFSCGLSENIEKAYEFYNALLDTLVSYLGKITIRIFALPGDEQIERKTLSSVICDWCETLPPATYEQLFPDGTERILGLLKVATNDDDTLLRRLAKLVTGLRIEDWDSSTLQSFENSLIKHKETAEAFECHESETEDSEEQMHSDYMVSYIEDGKVVTKRFDRVDRSRRSNLLFNQISSALKAMGQSISEQEKRQVIMEILQKLC